MKKEVDIDQALAQLKMRTADRHTQLSYGQLMHKIAIAQKDRAPKNLVLSTLALVTLMVGLNLFLLAQGNNKSIKDNNLANKMGLITNNSIYGGI